MQDPRKASEFIELFQECSDYDVYAIAYDGTSFPSLPIYEFEVYDKEKKIELSTTDWGSKPIVKVSQIIDLFKQHSDYDVYAVAFNGVHCPASSVYGWSIDNNLKKIELIAADCSIKTKVKKLLNKALSWWNNLPYCQKKRQEWLAKRMKANEKVQTNKRVLKELHWPENVEHRHQNDFLDSDWIYQPGEQLENWVCWFFGTRTVRCTVLRKTTKFHQMDGPVPSYYLTAYEIKHNWSGFEELVLQSCLSR